MRRHFLAFTMLFLIATCSSNSLAEVTVSPVFSDHMVLQRLTQTPIWGTADPGVAIEQFSDFPDTDFAGIRTDRPGQGKCNKYRTEHGHAAAPNAPYGHGARISGASSTGPGNPVIRPVCERR